MRISHTSVGHYNVRFYDNDANNWENDMRHLGYNAEFIKVDDYQPNYLLKNKHTHETNTRMNEMFITEYFRLFGERNTFSKYFERICKKPINYEVYHHMRDTRNRLIRSHRYVNNGVTMEQLDEMEKWSDKVKSRGILLIDWDRTITVMEGMPFWDFTDETEEKSTLLRELEDGTIKLEDLAEVLFGGRERMHKLMDTFRKLRRNRTHIYILTHNINAGKKSPNRAIFVKLVNYLLDVKYGNRLIYSSIDNEKYLKHFSAKTILANLRVTRKKTITHKHSKHTTKKKHTTSHKIHSHL